MWKRTVGIILLECHVVMIDKIVGVIIVMLVSKSAFRVSRSDVDISSEVWGVPGSDLLMLGTCLSNHLDLDGDSENDRIWCFC